MIGTSGTILSLGALALSEDGVVRDEALRNRRVSAKAIHRLRKRLTGSDLEARLHMDGLDPRRADIAVAGSVLLDSVLRRLGADDITLCDLALREGLVLDYIHRNTAHDPQDRALPRRPPPQRHRAGRAVRVFGGARAARRRSWRCRSSTRRAPSTSSPTASASGWSTARCSTTPACTSATSAIIAIRIT